MTLLVFDRSTSRLVLLGDLGICRTFPAANNAARASRGPWPAGHYRAERLVPVDPSAGGGEDAEFGAWFLRFAGVPGRTGMGIHAGRQNRPDGLGRRGHEHATMGCIRTTADATTELALWWQRAPGALLWVVPQEDEIT